MARQSPRFRAKPEKSGPMLSPATSARHEQLRVPGWTKGVVHRPAIRAPAALSHSSSRSSPDTVRSRLRPQRACASRALTTPNAHLHADVRASFRPDADVDRVGQDGSPGPPGALAEHAVE